MSEVTRSVQRIYTNAKLKVELDKWRSGELVTAETAALEDKLEAENKAHREAARRVTGGVSHRDLHVLGPSSRLAEAIDALRAALKQGEE